MNESDIRAELHQLATSPAGPARLDMDAVLRQGRKRIRRRRVGALHVSVAAAALVVLSSIGIVRLADQITGPGQTGTPSLQISEAGAGTNPANRQWTVQADYPARTGGTRLAQEAGQQATLVQGHVAF